jgi:hypothetical protein
MLRNFFGSPRAGNSAGVNHSFQPTLEALELRDCPSAAVVSTIQNFALTQVQPVLNLAQQFQQQAVTDLTAAVNALNQGAINQAIPLLQSFENDLQVAAALDRIAEFEVLGLAQVDNALVQQGQEDALEHTFVVGPLLQQLQAGLQGNEVGVNFINAVVHPNEDFDFVHLGHHNRGELNDVGDNNGQGVLPGPDHPVGHDRGDNRIT